jgi:schlafen family protein
MLLDLFRDDLTNATSTSLYSTILAFTRLTESTADRPRESFVLDFKQAWNDSAIQTVAAFAHTFGGLLIIGVVEQSGVPTQCVGVEIKGELKTAIASSIATNISPTPPYEIAECALPQDPSKKLAVIRVRQGQELYYYTKKSSGSPIYVRNEDQTVPADASQLRTLVERHSNRATLQSDLTDRINFLVSSAMLLGTPDSYGLVHRPPNFSICLVPFEKQNLPLDSDLENEFRKLIRGNFAQLWRDNIRVEERRSTTWYRHRWIGTAMEFEALWQVTSAGDVAYTTQVSSGLVKGQAFWSLSDRVADLICLLRTVGMLWRRFGMFGEARIMAGLNVDKLGLYKQEDPSRFPSVGYKRDWLFHGTGIDLAAEPSPNGYASLDINFSTLNHDLPELLSNLLNQLLRSLGHTAPLSELRTTVTRFMEHYFPSMQ